ncbi:MAG: LysM peptidoglycan-binding domain-containing protein [Candidatus Nanopelagicales bacterium]
MSTLTADRPHGRMGRLAGRRSGAVGRRAEATLRGADARAQIDLAAAGDQLTDLLDAVARTAGVARGRVLQGFVTVNEELAAVEVSHAPWRFTRRGRVVVAAVVVVLLGLSLAAGLVSAASVTASAREGSFAAGVESGVEAPVVRESTNRTVPAAAATSSIVVRPGDTLWSIAVRALPDRDPREAVVALREVNQIDGGDLAAGQRLRLPVRG